MRHFPHILILLLVLGACGHAQLASGRWLVQRGPTTASATVFEMDVNGNLIASWPGPQTGALAVVKDLFGRVLVLDGTGSRVDVYLPGIGRISTDSVGGAQGLAILPSGTMAFISANPQNVFLSGTLNLVPLAGAPPPPIMVGAQPVGVVGTESETAWVLCRLPGRIYRATTGIPQPLISLTGVSTNLPREMVARPGGGVMVSFELDTSVAVFAEDGSPLPTITLPEPPAVITCDGDRTLYAMGLSGTIYRVRVDTGLVFDSFVPALSPTYGRLIADQGDVVWLEDIGGSRIVGYGLGGQPAGATALPAGTLSPGDPFGLQYQLMAAPLQDSDSDTFSNRDELLRGSRVDDQTDVPATLTMISQPGVDTVLEVSAPGRAGRVAVTLLSLSGTVSSSVGFVGAPYLPLTLDTVSYSMLVNDPLASQVLGTAGTVLDVNGKGLLVTNLNLIPLAPGSIVFHAAALVLESNGPWVDVASNSLTFGNP